MHMHVRTRAHDIHTYIHTHTHTNMHTYTHSCKDTRVPSYLYGIYFSCMEAHTCIRRYYKKPHTNGDNLRLNYMCLIFCVHIHTHVSRTKCHVHNICQHMDNRCCKSGARSYMHNTHACICFTTQTTCTNPDTMCMNDTLNMPDPAVAPRFVNGSRSVHMHTPRHN
jgi:hypothetical protein